MADNIGLHEEIQVQGQVAFYFGDLYPAAQTVWVDKELEKRSNLKHLSGLRLKTYRTWPDWLVAIGTLGIYVPIHYQISAKGVDYDMYR